MFNPPYSLRMRWFRGFKKRQTSNLVQIEYERMKLHLENTERIAARKKVIEEQERLRPILEAERAWHAAYNQRWALIELEERLKIQEAHIEEERLKQKEIDDERERVRKIMEDSLKESLRDHEAERMGWETEQEIWEMLGDSRD